VASSIRQFPALIFAALLLFAGAGVAQAQQTGTISGRVTNAQTGQPIAAAQVHIPNLNLGVLTQQNGRFILLNVPAGSHTLIAERIGFRRQETAVTVTAGATVERDIQITEQALALSEIVVTGTAGGTERRAVGNVVSRVNAAEVTERAAISNMQEMLSGRAPGLSFQRSSGNIGTGSQIRIRGVSSMSLGQQPLIFVDGVRVNNSGQVGPAVRGGRQSSSLDDFNPEDIESIEIIKGPAAATLYGTEASAGVIQIITKKGQQGAPQFDVTVNQGSNFMINPAGRIGEQWGCRVTTRPCPEAELFRFNIIEHERDVHGNNVFQRGHTQGYNIGVRGGTDAIRYFLSGDFDDHTGIVAYNTLQRTSLRGNVGVLFSEALRLDVSTGFTTGSTSYMQQLEQGGIWENALWAQGSLLDTNRRGFLRYTPEEIATVSATRDDSRFTGSATFTHEFRQFLTNRLIVGLDHATEENQILVPRHPDGAAGPFQNMSLGDIRVDRPINRVVTVDWGASAKYAMNPAIGLTTSVGAQFYSSNLNRIQGSGTVFASPAIRSIEGATNKTIGQFFEPNKSFGVYFQQEAAINDRIYLTGAVRADDNSAFGSDFNAAIYPKLSATWVVSEEPFFRENNLLNMLRLRSAWGQSGRQPATFAATTIYAPTVGPGGAAAIRPSQLGNPNVGPEVSTELEGGFDAALFNDRISIEATGFYQWGRDMLLNVSLPPTMGFAGNQDQNLGAMDNWGWELRVDGRAFETQNFALDLGFSGSHTMNEIKDLGGIPETISGAGTTKVGLPWPIYASPHLVSAEFDQFRRPVNLMCDAGRGRFNMYPGGEIVPCMDPRALNHHLVLGTVFPQYTWAFDGSVTVRNNLQVFTLVEGEFGRWNSDTNAYCQHTPCYPNVRDALLLDDPVYVEGVLNFSRFPFNGHDFIRYDAAFWKMRELGARYQLPDNMVRRTGADRASLAVSARNPWTIWQRTKDIRGAPVTDPELTSPTGGSALGQMPGISSVTATLRVSF
jgi:TonB-linked SusC/RagA family outer membrane protein